MTTLIDIQEFLRGEGPVLDVRSPGEYSQGHIPGAINLPLFTNEERTVVGTLYKQTGKEAACHKGSSYGMLGMPPQPSNEQFENEIALKWAAADSERVLWIEDESRMIGKCKIPDAIFKLMHSAPMVFIECPLPQRLENLSKDYGNASPEELIKATERLCRRLGGARTTEIITFIRTGNLRKAMELTLQYYDAAYRYGLTLRSQDITHIKAENLCGAHLIS